MPTPTRRTTLDRWLAETRPNLPEGVTVTINEFCAVLNWSRSRFYRNRDRIKIVNGYGQPMIPVSELERILEAGK